MALAKVLTEFAKDVAGVRVQGRGCVDGQAVAGGADQGRSPTLPSREELIAKLLFLLQSPITRFVRVLAASGRSVCAIVLDQVGQEEGSIRSGEGSRRCERSIGTPDSRVRAEGGEEMAIAVEDFIQQIDGMTVLELNNLVKALEEHYGVSAAAAAAPRRRGRWRRRRRRAGRGADRVHRRPDGRRRQEDQRHQGGPRGHQPRPQGGQGSRRGAPRDRSRKASPRTRPRRSRRSSKRPAPRSRSSRAAAPHVALDARTPAASSGLLGRRFRRFGRHAFRNPPRIAVGHGVAASRLSMLVLRRLLARSGRH